MKTKQYGYCGKFKGELKLLIISVDIEPSYGFQGKRLFLYNKLS